MNAPEKIIERSSFLGGSDAAAVLGVSPWATPLDIFLEKTGQEVREIDPARAKLFKRGKRLEPIVVDMLIEEYDLKVTKRSTPEKPNRYVDQEHAFLAVEIDFEWEVTPEIAEQFKLPDELVGTIQNGEVKTLHPFATAKFGDAETEDVPIEYAAQAMDGLMVTGRKLCMFGVLVGADNLVVYWIKRDDDTIKAMRPRLVGFWRDHVLAGVPPKPLTLPDVTKLFRKAPASEVEATPEIAAMCDELQKAKDAAAAAEDRQVEMKFEIGKFMLGEAGILLGNRGKLEPTAATVPGKHLLTRNGAPLLTVAMQASTRIDSDRLRTDHPEIAAECSKTSNSIVFRKPSKGARK